MNIPKHSLQDVFGVTRNIPLTYRSRSYVDDVFCDSLTRQKHVVVYGGSKQGKTCLRKKCLSDDSYITVQCSSNTEAKANVYGAILKEAGAEIEVTSSKTITGNQKLSVSLSGEGQIPFVSKAKGEGAVERDSGTEKTRNYKRVEIDPEDPNDLIRVLEGMDFAKLIVLEDFHYLPADVQEEIAIDLKAFHEKSDLSFIIVGVWLEDNRLILYNGDLAGRVETVNADRWKKVDLEAVVEEGQSLLNIVFDENARDLIVERSQYNVGLVQNLCYRVCREEGIEETQEDLVQVGSVDLVESVAEETARNDSGRYHNFLREFSEGFRKTELDLYRWIMYVVVTRDINRLKRGVQLARIHKIIDRRHPRKETIYRGSIRQALERISRLQNQKRIQPVVLDFDSADNLLRVVDSEFILYLANVSRDEVLKAIELGDV